MSQRGDEELELVVELLDRWAGRLVALSLATLGVAGLLVMRFVWLHAIDLVSAINDFWILVVIAIVVAWLRRVTLTMGAFLRLVE